MSSIINSMSIKQQQQIDAFIELGASIQPLYHRYIRFPKFGVSSSFCHRVNLFPLDNCSPELCEREFFIISPIHSEIYDSLSHAATLFSQNEYFHVYHYVLKDDYDINLLQILDDDEYSAKIIDGEELANRISLLRRYITPTRIAEDNLICKNPFDECKICYISNEEDAENKIYKCSICSFTCHEICLQNCKKSGICPQCKNKFMKNNDSHKDTRDDKYDVFGPIIEGYATFIEYDY